MVNREAVAARFVVWSPGSFEVDARAERTSTDAITMNVAVDGGPFEDVRFHKGTDGVWRGRTLKGAELTITMA